MRGRKWEDKWVKREEEREKGKTNGVRRERKKENGRKRVRSKERGKDTRRKGKRREEEEGTWKKSRIRTDKDVKRGRRGENQGTE